MVSDVLELMCGPGDTFSPPSTSPFTTIYLPPHDDTSHRLRDSKSSLGTTVVSQLGLRKLDLEVIYQPTSSVFFGDTLIYVYIYSTTPAKQLSIEKKTWLFRVYRGLYCPVIWGL